jgi:hypothetical protein
MSREFVHEEPPWRCFKGENRACRLGRQRTRGARERQTCPRSTPRAAFGPVVAVLRGGCDGPLSDPWSRPCAAAATLQKAIVESLVARIAAAWVPRAGDRSPRPVHQTDARSLSTESARNTGCMVTEGRSSSSGSVVAGPGPSIELAVPIHSLRPVTTPGPISIAVPADAGGRRRTPPGRSCGPTLSRYRRAIFSSAHAYRAS